MWKRVLLILLVRSGACNTVLFFSHIPHTSGSAFSRHLATTFKPHEVAAESRFAKSFGCSARGAQNSTTFAPGVRVAFGHDTPSELRWRCGYPDTSYEPILMLRDPLAVAVHLSLHLLCPWLRHRNSTFAPPAPSICHRWSLTAAVDGLSAAELVAKISALGGGSGGGSNVARERMLAWVAQAVRGGDTPCIGFDDDVRDFYGAHASPTAARPPTPAKAGCSETELLGQAKKALQQVYYFGIAEQWQSSLRLFHGTTTTLPPEEDDSPACTRRQCENDRRSSVRAPRGGQMNRRDPDPCASVCSARHVKAEVEGSATNTVLRFLRCHFEHSVLAELRRQLATELAFYEYAQRLFAERLGAIGLSDGVAIAHCNGAPASFQDHSQLSQHAVDISASEPQLALQLECKFE